MATNTIKTRLQHAFKTEEGWEELDPILLEGEYAISSDKTGDRVKIGDGSSKWSELPYETAITPYPLTVQFNGAKQFDYDGSVTRTLNITPSAIGAATSGHTHAYLPLNGSGSMTGDLKFSSNQNISWPNGTYQQRISITDDSTSGTNVFHFQQSTDSGSTFTDLMTIKDDGKVVAKTFVGSLSGTATNATTASKVANNLIVKLNGGATEGTNLFTFNGSAAKTVNITPSAIGAATTSHTHGLLHSSFAKQIDNTTTDSGWSMLNSTYSGYMLLSLRTQKTAPTWTIGNFSAGIAFGGADTKGVITVAYDSPTIKLAGGNGSAPVWNIALTGTTGTSYNLDNLTNVKQSATSTSNYRPLVMGSTNSSDTSTLATTVTSQVYASTTIYAQPSTGTIFATKFKGAFEGDITGNVSGTASKLATKATVSTYDFVPSTYISDGQIAGIYNTNSTLTSNGFAAANTSAGILFGRTNGAIMMAAQAGQTIPAIWVKEYYTAWGEWAKLIHSLNYTDYTVTKTGSGASGTWGISISGGAAKLTTARTINGTSFNGTGNITTANWGTARNIYIADSDSSNTGAAVSVNGSANATLKLPATIKATLKGNSDTTTKWATARTITVNGDYTGSVTLDGSADINFDLWNYYSKATVANTNNYPYHRIAKLDVITNSYQDKSSTLYISQDFNGGGFGIIRICLRTNNTGTASAVEAYWLVRKGLAEDCVKIGIYNVFGETYADVFFKTSGTYASAVIRDIASGTRGNVSRTWTLINSSEVNGTTTADKLTSSECWASIETAATELHSQAYSTTVTASDAGDVYCSERAYNDESGNNIKTSYASAVSVSGQTVTLTSKSGATLSTITTQDTKNTAGSTDSSSKLFLIGATSQTTNPQTYSHDTIYAETDGHLYSNSKQVVNLSDTQALINKTYNGYTLAAACAKGVTDSSSAAAIGTGTSLPTERDIYYGLPTINNSHAYTSSTTIYAPTVGGTSGYTLIGNGATAAPIWQAPTYATCSTAAATTNKVVTVTNFKLVTGAEITVKFTVTNTASSPTLNVSSTGAKAIYYRGAAISAGYLAANRTYTFRYNGTQYELVGDINTDAKATQTNTTTSANYRVVLSTNANDTTETNTLRKSANFTANPNTGAFYAKGYDRIDISGQTLDIDTLNLSNGSPQIMKYIEKTSGGATNITNIPVTGVAFILNVELIRWAGTTDYITKQIFSSVGALNNEYVRYCTNGTWGTWVKRVFTDTNTKVTQTVTTSNATYPLLLAPSGQTATTTTTSYFDSGVTLNPRTNTITANISGSATKLTTARTIRTNLGSTSTASFDGSANITPGVTGTLPIANGGTGATTASAVLTNLGITATATELNYTDGVTSNIQTQINSLNRSLNNKFNVGEWWYQTDTTKNCDDLTSGIVFAYRGSKYHKTPTTGTLVSFSCNRNMYPLQLQGGYNVNDNSLYFRNKNDDNSTWGEWKKVNTHTFSLSGTTLTITS